MKQLLTILLLFVGSLQLSAQSTLRQQMEWMQREYGVHFVYDATLPVDVPYRGEALRHKTVDEALRTLFAGQNITYSKRRNNIVLRAKATSSLLPQTSSLSKPKTVLFLLQGIVTDENGEPLVNASVYEVNTRKGCTTDEHGRYLLYLPPGTHQVRASYVGHDAQENTLKLTANAQQNFRLVNAVELEEVEVTADLNSALFTTQTGKTTLTTEDLDTEFSLLSAPDLVKTIQRISGVTPGTELASDLYVHGGNGDENLFLIDGTPLYHTNHAFGLFSSFNTDIVKNVDFYKSGFPARYSGRVSSVIDARTREGDMERYHGSLSIGLTEGRLQVEGPIVKNKTSFNIGLRSSWVDLVLVPMSRIIKTYEQEEKQYSFNLHDFNAKVTHRINDRNTLWASFYSGGDRLDVKEKWNNCWYDKTQGWDDHTSMMWGKLNGTLCWDTQLRPDLTGSVALVATRSSSSINLDEQYFRIDSLENWNPLTHSVKDNRTFMRDLGAKADFRFTPNDRHNIRFGGQLMHHTFRPQTFYKVVYYNDPVNNIDTAYTDARYRTHSTELTLYGEDEMRLTDRFSLNLGASYTATFVPASQSGGLRGAGRTYHEFDPRLAMKYEILPWLTAKASCTRMSQNVHRIASSLISLPTDFWVPTTDRVRPTTSWQWAAGLYAEPDKHWRLGIEGYYKLTDNLLQHRRWGGIMPDVTNWESDITMGRGRAYGVELDARYHTPRLTLTAAYTLGWSERNFPELHEGWFFDQFDNRHCLDLSAHWKISKHVTAMAAWTFHSGNRITLPRHYALEPIIPDGSMIIEPGYVYEEPNNYRIPAYHRLDAGFDFHREGRKGRQHIWNLSVYNAYCRFNAMYVEVRQNWWGDSSFQAYSRGFIPIIPSFSYTFKF